MRNINRRPLTQVVNPGEPGYGPEECEECGAEMHQVRRGHGFKLCTPCQAASEARSRLRR